MLSTMNLDAVKDFLKICRKEIPKGNCYFVNRILNVNGKKISSKQALINIEIINTKQIWDYILKLEPFECIKVDFDYDFKRDSNSEIFVFKKNINKHVVYIKLTMRKKGIICISFHEDY